MNARFDATLKALQAAGFDIQTDTVERGKVFKLGVGNTGVHEIGVSATELIALSIGRELLYPLLGTQYWRGIETFWNKVQETVPNGVYDHYIRYRKTLHVFGTPSKTYEHHEGMLKTINRAILEHRVVEIEYESVGKPVTTRRDRTVRFGRLSKQHLRGRGGTGSHRSE